MPGWTARCGRRNQDRFLKEDGVVMVATIAFGMGIDKPDVRFVAHLDLPKSLEAYYQETGRAGRDGLPADAWMAYGIQDVGKIQGLIAESDAPERQKQIDRQKLDALLGYCETVRCRRQVLLEYFGDALPQPCGNCDTCLEPVEAFDGTELARKALSCVYRTGQRFGVGHVIDVLTGTETDRIRQLGHDKLSTWGIGRDLSKAEWKSVFRQLVAAGLLIVDTEGHGGLHLAPDCREVLRGEKEIQLRREAVKRTARGKSAGKAGGRAARALPSDPAEASLFQALRARRLELAREQGVPPYVIFHDATLTELAHAQPRSMTEFATVPGVGQAKLLRYAGAFLEVIEQHVGVAAAAPAATGEGRRAPASAPRSPARSGRCGRSPRRKPRSGWDCTAGAACRRECRETPRPGPSGAAPAGRRTTCRIRRSAHGSRSHAPRAGGPWPGRPAAG